MSSTYRAELTCPACVFELAASSFYTKGLNNRLRTDCPQCGTSLVSPGGGAE